MEEAKGLDFSESIYNLLHRTQCPVVPPKQPRYKSVFSGFVREELKRGKQENRTLGSAIPILPKPDKFLRKNASTARLSKLSKQSRNARPQTVEWPCKPNVPRRGEALPKGEKTKKDFLQINASTVTLARARKPTVQCVDTRIGDTFRLDKSGLEPLHMNKKINASTVTLARARKPTVQCVDTRIGDTFRLDKSGLEPLHMNKKNFGKVPHYLHQRKVEEARAQEEYEAYIQERMRRGNLKQIPEEERSKLLEGLKQNWEDLHLMYQKMSIFTDTFGKKRRKLYIESEMKQLERDISLLEGHPTVFILG